MRERAKWGLVGFSVGAATGFFFHKLGGLFAERPPIIVRGGSISFETNCGWREDAGEWSQGFDDVLGHYKVEQFVVRITTDGVSTIRELRGKRLNFTHGTQPFMVTLKNDEPRIGPYGLLKNLSKAGWRIRYAGGPRELGQLRVLPSNETHVFEEGEEAWIEYEFKEEDHGKGRTSA